MSDNEERSSVEILRGGARDVTASDVSIRQGGARSVSAKDVTIRQGGAVRVQAEEIEIVQGGIGLATAQKIRVTAGGVGGVLADEAELEQTAAHLVVARGDVKMEQGAAGLVVANTAQVRDSAIGVLLSGRVEGHNIRVLMGPAAGLAFGAGAGLALLLFGRLFRR